MMSRLDAVGVLFIILVTTIALSVISQWAFGSVDLPKIIGAIAWLLAGFVVGRMIS